MVVLGSEKILTFIRRIGLAPTKAKHVHALSQLLLERHDGEVPAEREALEALPGVGRKTANVVLEHAFGQPTLAVDTHVHRVANRLGMCNTTSPEKTEQVLLQRIAAKLLPSCHLRLVLFGRYTCIARHPHCPECFAKDLCCWPEKRTSGLQIPRILK
jgi:endonuclease-3